ncbi:DUF2975 domain-containing protein [Lutibacter citreus]|uniref:DUF2975 domain-containing protein n=1 Tax=Lutibacter citreus TaxID=2138210 RepID=UPI000DBE6A96|nr:DUF2975 domain-containing protein [Lutibacter citreus]
MNKNTLLNISLGICQLAKILFIIIAIGITFVFIHVQIDKDFYSKVEFGLSKENSNLNLSNTDLNITSTWHVTNLSEELKNKDKTTIYKELFKLNKLTKTSLYLQYFKLSFVLLMFFLAVSEFQKIIESVKSHKTFGIQNVNSFRKIGTYIVVSVLFTMYTSVNFEQGGYSGFSISFNQLFLALIAFIMAEIFKEGNILKEENNLTI